VPIVPQRYAVSYPSQLTAFYELEKTTDERETGDDGKQLGGKLALLAARNRRSRYRSCADRGRTSTRNCDRSSRGSITAGTVTHRGLPSADGDTLSEHQPWRSSPPEDRLAPACILTVIISTSKLTDAQGAKLAGAIHTGTLSWRNHHYTAHRHPVLGGAIALLLRLVAASSYAFGRGACSVRSFRSHTYNHLFLRPPSLPAHPHAPSFVA